ncbi:hypothetical protein KPG71_18900 [Roseovarius sp. PS-C2]|uniref:hypothetical protein n=1 Tax=Roseovarius sp. PS-C2 TaxID=2820814 RepID=UPI001C0B1285|nr:hypothetical protein [Roseovarius sp. PS-C2]MBU3262095.1 hypothetical protein [Roseovarius sp. PS-C2]
MIDRLRLLIAKLACPDTHRVIEALDLVTDPRTAANDLIRGGDALARGWGCSPEILYNGARIIREMERSGR